VTESLARVLAQMGWRQRPSLVLYGGSAVVDLDVARPKGYDSSASSHQQEQRGAEEEEDVAERRGRKRGAAAAGGTERRGEGEEGEEEEMDRLAFIILRDSNTLRGPHSRGVRLTGQGETTRRVLAGKGHRVVLVSKELYETLVTPAEREFFVRKLLAGVGLAD
jgi:hypothetical protein